MKTLGLIGGMSWESTAVYYRHLNQIARQRLGGLHSARLLLWSFDFAEIETLQASGRWDLASERMIEAAKGLARAGADAIVICTNTMHKMAHDVQGCVNLPLIHIADATASALKLAQVQNPLLLATRFTMEETFYSGHLASQHGIQVTTPDAKQREVIHRVIYEELCRGEVSELSLHDYLKIIKDQQHTHQVDGVILGCTEITLLLKPEHTALPQFDTTWLHARAAMDFALGQDHDR